MDKDWMPRLVLLAKNTYVWLGQLSQNISVPSPRLTRSLTKNWTCSPHADLPVCG